jgi:hypothetical protein
VRSALGDVGGREPRDHLPVALGQLDHVLHTRRQAHQVAVRELHPLWRACGPGGVDQRQQVVRLYSVDDRRRVEVGIGRLELGQGAGAALPVDHNDVLEVGQVLLRLQ